LELKTNSTTRVVPPPLGPPIVAMKTTNNQGIGGYICALQGDRNKLGW